MKRKVRTDDTRRSNTPALPSGAVHAGIAAPVTSSGRQKVLSCGDGAEEASHFRQRSRGVSPSTRASRGSAQVSEQTSNRRSGRKQPSVSLVPLPNIDLDEVKEGWTFNPGDYAIGSRVAFRTVTGNRASTHVARFDGPCEDAYLSNSRSLDAAS